MAARRISIVNQKGGVGKTTTAVNLAAALAARGKRVCLIDCDPQGNAGDYLGLAEAVDAGAYTTAQFVMEQGAFAPQRNVGVPGLDVLPSNGDLALLEFELLKDSISGPRRLSKSVGRIAGDYDFIIIDCPPTLGMLAVNAMVAGPEIIVPVELSTTNFRGTLKLHETLQQLRESVDPALHILGMVGTFYAEAAKGPKEALAALRQLFPKELFTTYIHTSQSVDDAAGKGTPISIADPKSRAGQQFNALTEEVLARG